MPGEIGQDFCEKIVKRYSAGSLARPAYVIHEHHAKRLHWDLRLEIGGVLKSWALPKSPPEAEGERRLAVEVDDHPIEYALFEGEIPAGNYGAGQVKIWDRGTFEIIDRREKKIIFNLSGGRLKGKYCLLHFKPAEKGWLFFN